MKKPRHREIKKLVWVTQLVNFRDHSPGFWLIGWGLRPGFRHFRKLEN